MEHNMERIIQQKIKELEQVPVNWDKERVWSSINKGRSSQSNRYVFYYTAATILLAGALIFYSIQLTERKKLDKQIRLIELAINRQANATTSPTPQECMISDVKPEHFFSERKAGHEVEANDPIRNSFTSVLQRNDPVDTLLFLLSESPNPVSAETEMISPVAINGIVEPIIRDHLPKQENNNVASRNKRRMRVRFFSIPEKKSPDAGESAPFILARIK